MATLNQKSRLRLNRYRFCWSQALQHNPQRRGRLRRITTLTPRKPNSAIRKVGKLKLSNGKNIYAKVYGIGSLPKKYAALLIKGKGHKDTPGAQYGILRGVYECLSLFNKLRKRSLYGAKSTRKIHVKKSLRSRGLP